MQNVNPEHAAATATQVGTADVFLTLAEYLERYDPETAVNIPYQELPDWLAARRGRLEAVERGFGLPPTRRSDGTRVYSIVSLGWAIDLTWAAAGAMGALPEQSAPKWFTTHTAAPIGRTTAEQRAAIAADDLPFEWEPLDPAYVV